MEIVTRTWAKQLEITEGTRRNHHKLNLHVSGSSTGPPQTYVKYPTVASYPGHLLPGKSLGTSAILANLKNER